MDSIKQQSRYLKTLFFLYFIGFGIGSPFFGIFYKHVIVNADGTPAIGLIGLLFFVMPLVSLIANIPAGIIADKFHSGKHLITVLCFGVAIFAALIGLAGEDFARPWGLGGKFIFVLVMLFFLNCCFLLFHFRHDPLIFYGAALAFIVLGFASFSGIRTRPAAQPIIIPWNHLKKDSLFQWFLVFIFFIVVGSNPYYTYTGYFFDDVMKTPLEIGLILGTWTIFEIPVMKFSRKLIGVFGNRWLIVSGLFLNGIRLIIFSFFTMETPFFWKWATALLQGPGFGLTHLGIIDFVDRRAHPDMRATYLSIMNVARMSLSSALGGILGSWLIKWRDGAFLMQFCGWGSLALILLFVLLVKRHAPQDEIAAG